MLALVSITGHYGGNLTHGTTFLGEYAPSFLRGLIGAAPRRPTPSRAWPPQTPISTSCNRCSSSAAARATTTTSAKAASASAATTRHSSVATRAAQSCPATSKRASCIYRTGLPPDDEAFMPAEGKTPLTAEQVEILRWWVGAGAPHDTTVGAIGAPGNVEPLLAAQLGLGGAAATAAAPAGSATADPQLVADSVRSRAARAPSLAERRASRRERQLARHCAQCSGARGVECGRRRDRRPEFGGHGARRCGTRRDRRARGRNAPSPRAQQAHRRRPRLARGAAAAHASEPLRQQRRHRCRASRTRRPSRRCASSIVWQTA